MKQSKWSNTYLCGLITAVLAPWVLVLLNYEGRANDANLVVGIPALAVAGFVMGYVASLASNTKRRE